MVKSRDIDARVGVVCGAERHVVSHLLGNRLEIVHYENDLIDNYSQLRYDAGSPPGGGIIASARVFEPLPRGC